MYTVLEMFHDLQDSKTTKGETTYYRYDVGDTYPRKGLNPSDERISLLVGDDNPRGHAVIALVDGVADETAE